MRLVSHCPSCGAAFRVVPDQLRIASGWVRCGQCQHVYMATTTLEELPDEVAGAAPAKGTASDPPDAVDLANKMPATAVHAEETASPHLTPEQAAVENDTLAAEAAAPEPSPPTGQPHAPDASAAMPATAVAEQTAPHEVADPQPANLPAVHLPAAEGLGTQDTPDADASPHAQPDSSAHACEWAAAMGSPGDDAPEPAADAAMVDAQHALSDLVEPAQGQTTSAPEASDLEDLSFVRTAQRRAFWHRGAVRTTLWLLLLAASMALAGQWVLFERDMLAARSPVARSLLEQICHVAHCKLQPWKHIEAVVIDTHTLRKLGDHTYRLGLSLRNTTSHPVAMPALEVTLLNAEDKIVARHVLMTDALDAPAVLTARGEWQGSILLDIAAPAPNTPPVAPVMGYRVGVFYP